MNKFVNISELCRIIDLIDPKTKKPLNHVVRYWEKEFNQIKPKKINNHRYYSSKDIKTIQLVKFLIKDKKFTIAGAKSVLKKKFNKLDEHDISSLEEDFKFYIKNKSIKLLNKINKIKNYGKKNSS